MALSPGFWATNIVRLLMIISTFTRLTKQLPGFQELPDEDADGDIIFPECIPEQSCHITVERYQQLYLSSQRRTHAHPQHGRI